MGTCSSWKQNTVSLRAITQNEVTILTPTFHVGIVNKCFSNALLFRPVQQNKANSFTQLFFMALQEAPVLRKRASFRAKCFSFGPRHKTEEQLYYTRAFLLAHSAILLRNLEYQSRKPIALYSTLAKLHAPDNTLESSLHSTRHSNVAKLRHRTLNSTLENTLRSTPRTAPQQHPAQHLYQTSSLHPGQARAAPWIAPCTAPC